MNTEDLRVIKTRKSIKDAFLKLYRKYPLEDISVKQICDEANCSRNTFYYHFQYKDNLYQSILYDLIENIYRPNARIVDNAEEIDEEVLNDYCANIIDDFRDKKDLIRILARNNNSDNLEKWIADKIYLSILSDVERFYKRRTDIKYELAVHYVASGLSSFLYNWLLTTDIDDKEALEALKMIHLPALKATSEYLQSLNVIR